MPVLIARRRKSPEPPTRPRDVARTLVIGLGNPIVGDDSVGLRVASRLRGTLRGRRNVVVDRDCWGGLRLMERMIGFDRAIVVDAACTGGEAGTIRLLGQHATTQRSASAHDVDLATALKFGRRAGAMLPADSAVHFVAIEVVDVLTFSESCSPAVARAIPRAAKLVLNLLADAEWRHDK